jgi:predicted peroxiredoxin
LRLLILSQGASWERRYQVSSLAASAASRGDAVDLCFFFAALDAWVRGGWDELDPEPPVERERLASLDFPPLTTLLDGARETGHLRTFACSASTRILGLEPPEVQARVDVLCGWQTFAKLIAETDRVVTF